MDPVKTFASRYFALMTNLYAFDVLSIPDNPFFLVVFPCVFIL